jgi:sulfur-oxidizing protein SoxX
MGKLSRVLLAGAILGLAACGADPKSSVGFTLPDGDVERGKADFVEFGCNACHVLSEVPQMAGAEAEAAKVSIKLGGETTRIRTYGELVTSIINPSHRVARRESADMADESGQSRMVNYNDVMTITQLVDLVAFLQSSYTLSPYQTTAYPVYWLPDTDKKGSEAQ